MKQLTKKIFQSKLLLSAIAIIYAYFLWLMISQSFMDSIHINVPIIFYDIPAKNEIKTQENIDVHVKGQRFDLRHLVKQNVSVSISAKNLTLGENPFTISQEHIFLPDEVKLIDYNPAQLTILVT